MPKGRKFQSPKRQQRAILFHTGMVHIGMGGDHA